MTYFNVQKESLEPLLDKDFEDGDHKNEKTIFPIHECWGILYVRVYDDGDRILWLNSSFDKKETFVDILYSPPLAPYYIIADIQS